MMGLFLSLMIATVVGTILWIVQNSIRPITQKLFSQSWHYYTGLIPVFFFLGGTTVINRLIQSIGSAITDTTKGTSLIPAAGRMTQEPISGLVIKQSAASSSFMNQLFTNLLQLENMKEVALLVILIWAVGAIVYLAVNVRKYRKFRHYLLQKSRVSDAVQCRVKVIISANATTPMVMGFWKPAVVLPDIPLREKEVAMILSHELLHLKRGDLLIKLMVLAAQAVHWFNPVVYFLSRQLNTLCELSCDEKVVREMDTESRRCYGEIILSMLDYSVMKRNVSNVICVSSLCNSKRNIKRRLINLMNAKKTKKSMLALSLMATVALTGIGAYTAYAADSALPETPKSYYEDANYLLEGGRNITVVTPDGTAITYDKDGNATETKGIKHPDSFLTDEQKAEKDKLLEQAQLYIDAGNPVPQEISDAMSALYGITPYVYEGSDVPPDLTYEEILERIKLHEEKGIPVPEAYLNALK